MLFTRKEIDGAHKDNLGKHFFPDFSLDLVFKQVKVVFERMKIVFSNPYLAKTKALYGRNNG